MFHFQSAHCNTPPTEMLQQLLQSLATPPKLTTVRVNSLKYDRETVIAMLRELLDKVVFKNVFEFNSLQEARQNSTAFVNSIHLYHWGVRIYPQ